MHLPSPPSHQLKQYNLHLQQRKPLAQTLPRVRIERDIPPAHTILPKLRLHLLHRLSPSPRDKLVRVFAPIGGVDMGTVGVPPHPSPFRDGDFTAEQCRRGGDAVDEL